MREVKVDAPAVTTAAPPELRRSERAVLKVLEKHNGPSTGVAELARALATASPPPRPSRRR